MCFHPNCHVCVITTLFTSCLCCSFFRRSRMSPTCRRRTKRLENCSSLRQPPSCLPSCQCLIQFLHSVRTYYIIFYFLPFVSWDVQLMVVAVMIDCYCCVVTVLQLLKHSSFSFWSMNKSWCWIQVRERLSMLVFLSIIGPHCPMFWHLIFSSSFCKSYWGFQVCFWWFCIITWESTHENPTNYLSSLWKLSLETCTSKCWPVFFDGSVLYKLWHTN